MDNRTDIFERVFRNKKLFAGIIALALFLFIAYASIPFLSAFFGAVLLAYIFHPLYKRFNRRYSAGFSASLVLIITGVLVIIPVILIVNGLINQIYLFAEKLDTINKALATLDSFFPFTTKINTETIVNQLIIALTGSLTPLFSNLIDYFFLIFLLFFLLFYLLIYFEHLGQLIKKSLPFTEKANNEIIFQFKQVTDATIIGTFFIAAVQGGLLAFNFYVLGIPNALFWGFVTGIFAFIPFTGAPLIWIPAALILFAQDEISKGVAMLVIGTMISTIDNILHPLINQRYGSIHPVKSIVGIFIGLYQFGMIGIFVGPLLVVYLFLFWKIYREET
ncbi:MAG: AI-2E family transporter [Nanoarchaeota archaeon]